MLGTILGALGATAAFSAGYQSMSPTGQWYGRTFTGLATNSKKLALTYDDGPNDSHTLRLLEVLSKHNVRATFFMIGLYVQKRPEIAREVAAAGHAIGNHTFSHPNLIFCGEDRVQEEIPACDRVLMDAIGDHSKLFRPPFGGRRPGTLKLVRRMGFQPIMWNVTGYDWRGQSADYVFKKVSARIRGGNVVLLHDGSHVKFGADRSQTVIATDRLIATYKDEGYEFLTIPEMMASQAQP